MRANTGQVWPAMRAPAQHLPACSMDVPKDPEGRRLETLLERVEEAMARTEQQIARIEAMIAVRDRSHRLSARLDLTLARYRRALQLYEARRAYVLEKLRTARPRNGSTAVEPASRVRSS
jgi:hypothetical protein